MFSSHFVFLYCELCIHLLCPFFSSCLFLIDCQEFLAFSLNVSSLLTLRVSEILFPSFPCYFYSLLIVSFDKQRFFLFMSINLYIFSLKLVIFPSCVRNLFSQYHEDILLYHQLEFFVFCFLHLCLQSTWNWFLGRLKFFHIFHMSSLSSQCHVLKSVLSLLLSYCYLYHKLCLYINEVLSSVVHWFICLYWCQHCTVLITIVL